MTSNEVIRMAREAVNRAGYAFYMECDLPEWLGTFAALVVAHEREECAKVFESLAELHAQDIAAAFYKSASDIRAIGNT